MIKTLRLGDVAQEVLLIDKVIVEILACVPLMLFSLILTICKQANQSIT